MQRSLFALAALAVAIPLLLTNARLSARARSGSIVVAALTQYFHQYG